MNYQFSTKQVEDLTGVEVTCWTFLKDGRQCLAAQHYYEKTEIDEEIKGNLIGIINKTLKDNNKYMEMNYTTWAGLTIKSNLPKDLLLKAMNFLQDTHLTELVEWQKTEGPKQMKKYNELNK